ncbi:hypothetical protein [Streptomyces sp. NRRL B-3648]|uniref:hypothetical protein n=1 Tax=Streptomyces sp. NRRL B-3648 TaxID=1519493 RepID=UPI000A940793|nr:hypothetical protein [Streptomyces sp. NRRL B-3648]
MIASFVGFVVIPMVMAGLARWAAARRRRGLAVGRAVHFRCRLDGHKGRLLVDPRLDGPVFLDRFGNVTALPRGGEALDATVSTNGRPPFEKVNLRYRTPEGQVLRLRLATHDARTLGAWLGERTRPVSAPARRLLLPAAPPWAVLAFAAFLFVGLATADVALLGKHTAAEVVRVDRDDDSCTVGWDGGAQRAAVDCDTTDVRSGDRIRITALPWPFLGEAVNTRTALSVVAVLGGGLGLVGLGGALMVNPLACARRVRLARRARPAIPPRVAAGGEAGEDRWPALDDDLSYASLAAAARHGDRHRPGPRVTPPRRGFGRTSMSPRIWVLTTALGTNAWYCLGFSSAAVLEDHFQLGHWRFLVFGTVGIASLVRIGWVATDRSALCGPVLRAARSEAGKGTWQPMRYVRLCRDPGEMVLVLFRSEGGEVTAPLFLQPISRSRGSEGRTVGGPAPVGEALVLDTGVGPLICEIDGVRFLPRGRATEAATDPARTRDELRSFAESHLRPVGSS